MPHEQHIETLFDRTQVADHNDEANGYWMIVGDVVYDVTRLMPIHPGGPRILQLYAGRDATHGFRRVHQAGDKLGVLLSRARLGRLRELTCFTSQEHASHCAVARALHSALSLIVEMQNALRADHAFRLQSLPEAMQRRSRYELQRAIETHARFHREYLDVLVEVSVRELAAAILPNDEQALRGRVTELQRSPSYVAGRSRPHALLDRFDSLPDQELDAHVACFDTLDSGLLRLWKRELSRALRTFECAHAAELSLADVGPLCGRLLDGVDTYFRSAMDGA